MIYSRILSTGGYLPSRIVTNDDLANTMDTTDAWITERSGIKQRHIVDDKEDASILGAKAAQSALINAGLVIEQIDLTLVATSTPSRCMPSTACFIQHLLAKNACDKPAFDINAACSGFVYGMSIADQFIRTGQAKRILLIGTDVFSRMMNWEDRSTCVLFGDGAGAMLLEASSDPGIMSTHLHADGSFSSLLGTTEIFGSNLSSPQVVMQGRALYRHAVDKLASVIDEALISQKLHQSDIDWLIPHQANIRIIQMMANKLTLPMERVIVTLNKHANTSAASIPLAFHEAVSSGKIKRGSLLLFDAFGAGLTWGSAIVRF